MQADPARSGRLTTKADRDLLREVIALARKAGLRVPRGITLRVVPFLKRRHAYTVGKAITVERPSLTRELLAHEVAHVIADQIVSHPGVHDHNRFWALVYGVCYQQVVQK